MTNALIQKEIADCFKEKAKKEDPVKVKQLAKNLFPTKYEITRKHLIIALLEIANVQMETDREGARETIQDVLTFNNYGELRLIIPVLAKLDPLALTKAETDPFGAVKLASTIPEKVYRQDAFARLLAYLP